VYVSMFNLGVYSFHVCVFILNLCVSLLLVLRIVLAFDLVLDFRYSTFLFYVCVCVCVCVGVCVCVCACGMW